MVGYPNLEKLKGPELFMLTMIRRAMLAIFKHEGFAEPMIQDKIALMLDTGKQLTLPMTVRRPARVEKKTRESDLSKSNAHFIIICCS